MNRHRSNDVLSDDQLDALLATPPEVTDARLDRLVAGVMRRARTAPRDTVLFLLLGPIPARYAGALCAGLLLLGWLAGSLQPSPAPAPLGRDVALLTDAVPSFYEGDLR